MSVKLVILGSGSATPTLTRAPSAQWLRIHDTDLLIDCGEGTQVQLMRYHLRMNRIRAIFISHLHGDHYFGLPGLISSMNLTGRIAPLKVYGPARLKELIEIQFESSDTDLAFDLEFVATNPEAPALLVEFNGFSVHTFPLNHRIPCTGFLFREKPKPLNLRKEILSKYQIPFEELPSIRQGADYTLPNGKIISNNEITFPPQPAITYAYCSDTSPFEQLADDIKGADCLYHEATFMDQLTDRARSTYHTTASEAARLALKAGVKKLLIGHFSSRYKDIGELLEEARKIFPATEAVFDGMEMELGE